MTFVAVVEPFTMSVMSARKSRRGRPSASARVATLSMTPVLRSSGVVSALAREIYPPASMATESVNVPPISMPTT
jgi:hypothetical protein